MNFIDWRFYMKNYIIPLLFIVTTLSGCTLYCMKETDSPESQTLVTIPSQSLYPDVEETFLGLEKITPDKIGQVELITELGTGHIIDVKMSPDNQKIAVFTTSGIFLYDSVLLREQGFLYVGADLEDIFTFNSDGTEIIFSDDTFIVSWDLSTLETDFLFLSAIPNWKLINLETSPDGERVVVTTTGSYTQCDGTGINYALYNLEGDLLYDRYYCQARTNNFYYFTEDGKLIIVFASTMTTEYPLEIYVVDIRTGILLASSLKKLIGHEGGFSEIIAGSPELIPSIKILQNWQIEKEEEEVGQAEKNKCAPMVRDAPVSYGELYSSEDIGVFTVINSGKLVRIELWDISQCKVEKKLTYPSAQETLISPDGKLLATTDGYNTYVWDMESKTIHFSIQGSPQIGSVNGFTFNSDGTRLVTGSIGKGYSASGNYLLSVWDTQTGSNIFELWPKGLYLNSFIATPDPDIVLVRDASGISFWNINLGYLITSFPNKPFEFDPKGNGVWISLGEQKNSQKIVLIDFRTGEIIQELSATFNTWIWDLDINRTSSLMEVTYRQSTILDVKELIDMESGEIIKISHQAVYPDEIKSDSDYYDLGEYYRGERTHLFLRERMGEYFPGSTTQMNDTFLITRESSGSYGFWDMQTGDYLGRIRFYGFMDIRDLIISPNNYYLAATGSDGIVRILGIEECLSQNW